MAITATSTRGMRALSREINRARALLRSLPKHWIAARNQIAERNQGLVFREAHKMSRISGKSVNDLAQEGNIGLLLGIERFDSRRGFAFSTYASWWIRQAIGRSSMEDRTIRIPIHALEHLSGLNRALRSSPSKSRCEPTLNELSTATGLEPKEIRVLLSLPQADLTLDQPVSQNHADHNSPDPVAIIAQEELGRKVEKVLGELDERERFVIVHRFGLLKEKVLTLREIGDRLQLSRERIRQIEEAALKKLRKRDWAGILRDYL